MRLNDLKTAEVWKSVPGYEGRYEVSSDGLVRSLDTAGVERNTGKKYTRKGKILNPVKTRLGYLQARLYANKKGKWFSVHALVLMAFVGPRPEGYEGCHKNGISGDNRLENLYWGTHLQNMKDRSTHGRTRSILTESQVREIVKLKGTASLSKIGAMYGVSGITIHDIFSGRSWRDVASEIAA